MSDLPYPYSRRPEPRSWSAPPPPYAEHHDGPLNGPLQGDVVDVLTLGSRHVLARSAVVVRRVEFAAVVKLESGETRHLSLLRYLLH